MSKVKPLTWSVNKVLIFVETWTVGLLSWHVLIGCASGSACRDETMQTWQLFSGFLCFGMWCAAWWEDYPKNLTNATSVGETFGPLWSCIHYLHLPCWLSVSPHTATIPTQEQKQLSLGLKKSFRTPEKNWDVLELCLKISYFIYNLCFFFLFADFCSTQQRESHLQIQLHICTLHI